MSGGDARAAAFDGLTCSAPDARAARMAEIVLAHVPSTAGPLRVLDLGCGTGGLLFRLASALPGATAVGIDISPANIAAAEAAKATRADGARVSFHAVDYLGWRTEPFDLITIDGVLHLIPCDTAALVDKLAADLKPGGVLVNAMPYACAYNAMFAAARKLLRATRTSATDAAILQIGRMLHGEMSDDLLRERVHYMYLPPQRVMNASLSAAMASRGLTIVATYPMASTSLAQLRHSVTVFSKT